MNTTIKISIMFSVLLMGLTAFSFAALLPDEVASHPKAEVQATTGQANDGRDAALQPEEKIARAPDAIAVKSTTDEPVDSTEMAGDDSPQIPDPFARTNKIMFEVNDRLYFWLLKPVAEGYARIPEGFRLMFSNLYDNLWAPSRMLNNLMQLRLKGAGNELLRFLLNSTVGIAGMGDAAGEAFGIKKQEADFGQTLGHYGMDHGVYLVFPFIGPTSLRDGAGLVGDKFMHPLTYVGSSHLTFGQQAGISAHERVNDASFRLGDYESFKEAAIDPYVAMRDAFVQHRKKKVDESRQ